MYTYMETAFFNIDEEAERGAEIGFEIGSEYCTLTAAFELILMNVLLSQADEAAPPTAGLIKLFAWLLHLVIIAETYEVPLTGIILGATAGTGIGIIKEIRRLGHFDPPANPAPR